MGLVLDTLTSSLLELTGLVIPVCDSNTGISVFSIEIPVILAWAMDVEIEGILYVLDNGAKAQI
jgi:hypothetical protein